MDASESKAGIPLGPFVLDEVIGQAGMGVVWRGTHVEQRVPVAVKVLTLEGSRDPLYLASLRNEVRGVAALDHPAVVRIFDQGVLPAHVSEATGGDLAAGSPFLVMELAEGGTLLPLCGRLGWAQVWRILHRDPYLRQLLQVDSHSPGEYRANGPLGHVPAFYDAVEVGPGDDLYVAPEERIVLW